MPEQVSRVQVSDHAGRRWLDRSEAPCMTVLNAWGDANPIYGHGLEGDEARYHELSETVLVRKDDTLTTVIHAPTAKLSVRRAVHHFGGGSA